MKQKPLLELDNFLASFFGNISTLEGEKVQFFGSLRCSFMMAKQTVEYVQSDGAVFMSTRVSRHLIHVLC